MVRLGVVRALGGETAAEPVPRRFFFPPNEGPQTSTLLITPTGSARIVEHRDELGAHEVPSTEGTARGATRVFVPRRCETAVFAETWG